MGTCHDIFMSLVGVQHSSGCSYEVLFLFVKSEFLEQVIVLEQAKQKPNTYWNICHLDCAVFMLVIFLSFQRVNMWDMYSF